MTEQTKARLIELWEADIRAIYIAKELGLSDATVYHWAKKLNLKIRDKFDDATKARLIELRTIGIGQKRIAEELGVTQATIQRWLRKLGLETKLETYKYESEILKVIVCKNCNAEYGTKQSKTKFCSEKCRTTYNKANRGRIQKCEKCDKTYRNYKTIKYCSDKCRDEVIEERKTERQKELEKQIEIDKKNAVITKLVRVIAKANNKTKECMVCNKEFRKKYAGKYCSDECIAEGKRKYKKINRDKRWRKNGKVDYSVTLEKLYKRDKGICYLCNKQTDYKHYIRTEENHFIALDNYPSIDHVLPIAKGGLHRWDNVKLAHRRCNYLKKDDVEEYQLFLGI